MQRLESDFDRAVKQLTDKRAAVEIPDKHKKTAQPIFTTMPVFQGIINPF